MQNKDLIQLLCVEIDTILKANLDALLHDHRFQAMEANWRSLHKLTTQSFRENVVIKILNLNKLELLQDLEEQTFSHLSRLIHEYEFDQAGGHPFGLMMVLHQVCSLEIDGWRSLAQIAAQSFCLLIASTQEEFSQTDYGQWESSRLHSEFGYFGIFKGRALARKPYIATAQNYLVYQESSDSLLYKDCCWLYVEFVIRAFIQDGWFFEFVEHFSSLPENSDYRQIEHTYYPEQTKRFSKMGCICLGFEPKLNKLYFHVQQSLYKNKQLDGINHLSTALCLSRIAHYLKFILRNKLSLFGKEECESYLRHWLQAYCAKSTNQTDEDDFDVRHPLEDAKLSMHEDKDKKFHCLLEVKFKPSILNMTMSNTLLVKIAH